MKHDLTNTTFIIPLRIDSQDRLNNLVYNLLYLLNNFKTNIFVLEADTTSKIKDIIEKCKDGEVKHIFVEDSNPHFHRTKYLNMMLDLVTTPVTVNYDVDILLPVPTYVECQQLIINGEYDLIYPFSWGASQRLVSQSNTNRENFVQTLDINAFESQFLEIGDSQCGHAQFFNTNSYREGFMENESYMSYGPEDKERMWRFYGLGYKLYWYENLVYHLEHSRGINSWTTNPHFGHNMKEYYKFLSVFTDHDLGHDLGLQKPIHPQDAGPNFVDPEKIKEYYSKFDYLKKYKK